MTGEGMPIYSDKNAESWKTLSEIKHENQDLLERAEKELEELIPELTNLIKTIEDFESHAVFVLDKGARLWGTPLMKVLRDRRGEDKISPVLHFFNDDNLKNAFGNLSSHVDEETKSFLESLTSKRAIFIDETIAGGRGLISLLNAFDTYGIDGKYYTLSHCSQGYEAREAWIAQLESNDGASGTVIDTAFNRAIHDQRVTIGTRDSLTLFTKEAANLFVIGQEDISLRYERIHDSRKLDASPRTDNPSNVDTAILGGPYKPLPNRKSNMTWIEYDQEVRKLNMETVKQLSRKILATLQEAAKQIE